MLLRCCRFVPEFQTFQSPCRGGYKHANFQAQNGLKRSTGCNHVWLRWLIPLAQKDLDVVCRVI